MSNQNVSFRELINEIHRLNGLLVGHESRQFSRLWEGGSFDEGFYIGYKREFQELLSAAVQQAKFQSEIAEVIDFIRQSNRFMEVRGELRDLFEKMETSAFNKAGEITAAQIKTKTILESAIFRALNFGFVETFAAGAFRLVNSFKSGDTQTIRPTIETKPPEAKAKTPDEKPVLPTGSTGHEAKSIKTRPRREAVAGSRSAKPKTILESAGFRALNFGFVETIVAGFLRLVKWFKPNNAQTVRTNVEDKSSANILPSRKLEKRVVKATIESKNVPLNHSGSGNKGAGAKGDQYIAPTLSESRLKEFGKFWTNRSSNNGASIEGSAPTAQH